MAHWSKIPAGELQAALSRLFPALGDSASDVIQCLADSPAFLAEVVSAMQSSLQKAIAERRYMYPAWGRAEAIMEKNFFGPLHMLHALGINPTASELEALAKIPWSERYLESVKDTHSLVAVYARSIHALQSGPGSDCFDVPFSAASYASLEFANEPGMCGWHLIRNECVHDTANLLAEAQRALLPEGEVLISARVLVHVFVGVRLTQREWFLPSGMLARTSTQPTTSSSVRVGRGLKGIAIEVRDDTHADPETYALSEVEPHF